MMYEFTPKTIRKASFTGSSACDIDGDTAHREFNLMKDRDFATVEQIADFGNTRMNVIDEISFANEELLIRLSKHLRNYTECQEWIYGSIPVVFLGDFRQLEPIGGTTIYKTDNSIYWEQALSLMVELKGMHRYKDCPKFGEIMYDFRERGLSNENRAILNERLINHTSVKLPNITTTKFATNRNLTRAKINRTVFRHYLQKHHANKTPSTIPTSAIVIKSSTKWSRNGKDLTFNQRKVLFTECTEASTNGSRSNRCDPFLCLFDGCEVMTINNDDVKNGFANGTQARFRKVCLKPNEETVPIKVNGYWVHSINISQVDYIVLEWTGGIRTGTFRVKPKRNRFRVTYPVLMLDRKMTIKTSMDITYFPIHINHATTGHKLQGKSLLQLVIAEWKRASNWVYVVLSRVTRLEGLYLTKRIPEGVDFSPDPSYSSMMERLRASKLVQWNETEDLHAML